MPSFIANYVGILQQHLCPVVEIATDELSLREGWEHDVSCLSVLSQDFASSSFPSCSFLSQIR